MSQPVNWIGMCTQCHALQLATIKGAEPSHIMRLPCAYCPEDAAYAYPPANVPQETLLATYQLGGTPALVAILGLPR